MTHSFSEKPHGNASRSAHKPAAQLSRAATGFMASGSMQYGGFFTKGWQRVNESSRYVQENIQKKCYNLLGSGIQLDKVVMTAT